AKNVVAAGMADRCQIALAYSIGVADPLWVDIKTFGTGNATKIRKAIDRQFDLRPRAIIEDLDLLRPIYTPTAAYGHFGRELPDFTWEKRGVL
ncbi:MAG: methionine adenosyltransferase domain-containing protein, partial [Candidatus Poseidoniia archaeon]|nr:methionine adenosyltransferase domain-containing protein [Candidatus Poseidoniia archaeon]